MTQISSSEELRTAIETLETENVFRAIQIKKEFELAAEIFTPAYVVNKSLHEVAFSPFMRDIIIGAAIRIGSGYLSKKLFVKGSPSLLRKLLGVVVQFGVTGLAVWRHHGSYTKK